MKKWGKFVLLALTLLTLIYIFTNSLQTAPESSAQSGRITSFLAQLYESLTGKAIRPSRLTFAVRKIAHFVEFALLGFFCTVTAASFFGKVWGRAHLILFWGLVAALVDEALQRFSRGRSPQVSDVFLDFGGFLAGFAVAWLITNLIDKQRRKHGVGVSLD